jgi:signal peptidase I
VCGGAGAVVVYPDTGTGRRMKALKVIVSTLASALCVIALLIAVAYAVLGHMGYRAEPVLSGSMEPTLPIGSLAVVKEVPASDVERGDVITFNTPGDKNSLTTHRVVGVEHEGSRVAYRTRGDANTADDPWHLSQRGTMGELVLDVPYAGYVTRWLAQPDVRTGVVILAALFAFLIILRRIWGREPADARPTRTAVGSAS